MLHSPNYHYYNVQAITGQMIVKILVVCVLLFGVSLYVVDFSAAWNQVTPHLAHLIRSVTSDQRYIAAANEKALLEKSYFVNTVGCKMPSFSAINEDIHSYFHNAVPVVCNTSVLIMSNQNALWINLNKTELFERHNISDCDLISCVAQPFQRLTDKTNEYRGDGPTYFRYGDRVQIKDEFVRVICEYEQIGQVYHDFHFFVPQPQTPFIRNGDTGEQYDRPNVLIIGLDSMSRLNFHRQMKSTAQLVLHQLGGIELLGYNKVGDNTYPNLVPVLTGLADDELGTACLTDEKQSAFDKCHFIWKDFAAANYTTAFAEDIGYLALFNYFRGGFERQPTDFYTHPLMIEIEKHVAYNQIGNIYMCLGNRTPLDVMTEYLDRFLAAVRLHSFFGFFWSSSFTHDFINYPSLIDEQIANVIAKMVATKDINRTIVFLMSDHGLRWGDFRNTYQGMIEESQPFLYAIFPEWFHNHYPLAVQNFKRNARRLTTHFDLYETLKDLLALKNLRSAAIRTRAKAVFEASPMPRGISLFLPVPVTRSCETASIESHWCTCHAKKTIKNPTSDSQVLVAARFTIATLNEMLQKYPQCHELHLNSIKSAELGMAHNDVLRKIYKRKYIDITVRLQTKPGFGEFESTVRFDAKERVNLTGTISRINLYGKQSLCVDDFRMKLYCYCGD